MLFKKLESTALIVLAVSRIGVGTAVLTYPAPAAEGWATNNREDQAGADLPPITHVIDDVTRLPSEAARLHAYVTRPFFPGELDYRQIPWLVDLDEGVRLARAEKRPLLLWTSGDDPLDRC